VVRNFPATTRQRFLAAAVAFAVASAPAATPNAHADDLKHKKHQVEQRLKAAKADLEDSSRAATKASRLRCSRRTMSSARAKRWPGTRPCDTRLSLRLGAYAAITAPSSTITQPR